MKKFLQILLSIVVLCAVLFPPTVPAFACSCFPMKDVEQAFAEADVVFRGIVRSDFLPMTLPGMEQVHFLVVDFVPYNLRQWMYFRHFRFEVIESWKGVDYKTATVLTGESSASCGMPFQMNHEYLVYANENDDGNLYTFVCERTAVTSSQSAIEDLKYLENLPTRPLKAIATGAILLVLILVLILVVVSLKYLRKRTFSRENR